jgi:hypothetical protein
MMKPIPLLAFLMAFSGITACYDLHEEVYLKENQITALKKKYSSEVFTYFFETVFSIDRELDKVSAIEKWKEDVKLRIAGNPSPGEMKSLREVIDLINQHSLPIKIDFTADVSDANFHLYFGSKNELDTVFDLTYSTAGIAVSRSTHGRIKRIDLGIIRNEDTQDPKRKKAVILEEVVQALGISGDSYFYPNSLFFEGRNYQNELAEIDKQVLQLLYDPLMPVNYSREKFETDFADVVYTLNTTEKLKAYFQEQAIPMGLLKTIGSTCFVEGQFYKHPTEVAVYIYGDAGREDSLQVERSIRAYNQISPYLQLKLTPFTNDYPSAGIVLRFQKKQDQEWTVSASIRTTKGSNTIRPKRVLQEVDISYKETPDTQQKKNSNITKVLYKCLGPLEMQNLDDLFTTRENEVLLGEDHRKLLEIIYQPIFADGYTLAEYEALLGQLEEHRDL